MIVYAQNGDLFFCKRRDLEAGCPHVVRQAERGWERNSPSHLRIAALHLSIIMLIL